MLYDVGALYCITHDNGHPSALLQPLCVGLAQGTALMLKQSLFERLLSGKLLGLISASLAGARHSNDTVKLYPLGTSEDSTLQFSSL